MISMKRRTECYNKFKRDTFWSKQKLNAKTVYLAISGEPMALMEIIDIYGPYINKLSMRNKIDSRGQENIEIDETVKRTLEISLIASIMKFNPKK